MAARRHPRDGIGSLLTYFGLGLRDSQASGHLVVEKSFSRNVGLHPLAVDHELWNSLLPGALDDLLYRTWRGLGVNLFVGDVVLGQKALGLAASRTPSGGVNSKLHI